jgi:hypothetical protein
MTVFNYADLADAIIRKAQEVDRASILQGTSGNFKPVSIWSSLLTTAVTRYNPIEIKSPVKYISVSNATDRNTNVYVLLQKNDDSVNAYKLSLNQNALELDFATDKFYIYWDAQAGKTLELTYSAFSKVSLRNVDSLSYVSEGSSYDQATPVSVAATATAILAADSDRIVSTVYNDGSQTVYLGNSAVTTSNGMPLSVGGYATIKNKGAVYGRVVSGTCSVRVLNEK